MEKSDTMLCANGNHEFKGAAYYLCPDCSKKLAELCELLRRLFTHLDLRGHRLDCDYANGIGACTCGYESLMADAQAATEEKT